MSCFANRATIRSRIARSISGKWAPMTVATSAAGAVASHRCVRYTARVNRLHHVGLALKKAGVVMYDVNGTGPVAWPMETTRWAAPSEMSCSVTGCVCSRKSP